MKFLFPLILLLTILATIFASQSCKHRDYGNGATVCVCNEDYCDQLNVKTVSKPGKGIVYETSKSGDRFASSEFVFKHNDSEHTLEGEIFKVNVDRSHRYQKIVGFGGAFTDSAGINIAKLSDKLQTRLVKDYYGSDGIEYTIGRIPIGGSDFSTRPYTYDDHPGDEKLEKFALQPEDLKFKIPFLKLAQQISPHQLKYFGSPWSAPAWMKTNNQINHGGLLKGHPGELYYKLFAKYFVKFLQEYQKHNVSMWGITIENEPGAGFDSNYKWNSLAFNETLERDFIKLDLGPELNKNGYTKDNLNVIIFDDQMINIKKFSQTLLADPEAAKYVSGIAYHWYFNQYSNRSHLDDLSKQFPEYFILSTEACEEWKGKKNHVSLGNWGTVNRYADDIIKDLNHYTTGWVDWNLVLDLQGGPNWVGNYVDAPIIVNQTSGEYYKQPFFYALGHFSKFLLPESVRISYTSEEAIDNDQNIELTVFERPDNGTVLTLLNKNDHPIELKVSDPRYGEATVHLKADSLNSLIWY